MTSNKKAKITFWSFLFAFLMYGVFALWAATPSTEVVQSRADGLHIGGKSTDRIAFFNGTPIVQPISDDNAIVNGSPLPTAAASSTVLANITNNISTRLNSTIVLLNQIRDNMTKLGLMATPTPTPTP